MPLPGQVPCGQAATLDVIRDDSAEQSALRVHSDRRQAALAQPLRDLVLDYLLDSRLHQVL
jgi:hypothetical protein